MTECGRDTRQAHSWENKLLWQPTLPQGLLEPAFITQESRAHLSNSLFFFPSLLIKLVWVWWNFQLVQLSPHFLTQIFLSHLISSSPLPLRGPRLTQFRIRHWLHFSWTFLLNLMLWKPCLSHYFSNQFKQQLLVCIHYLIWWHEKDMTIVSILQDEKRDLVRF